MISFHLFAVSNIKNQWLDPEKHAGIKSRVEHALTKAAVDAGTLEETLQLVGLILLNQLCRESSCNLLHASCWLLEAVGEKVPLYTLMHWKEQHAASLRLDCNPECNFAQQRFGFVPEQPELLLVLEIGLMSKTIACLESRIASLTISDESPHLKLALTEAWGELIEVLTSLQNDGLDAVIVGVVD